MWFEHVLRTYNYIEIGKVIKIKIGLNIKRMESDQNKNWSQYKTHAKF